MFRLLPTLAVVFYKSSLLFAGWAGIGVSWGVNYQLWRAQNNYQLVHVTQAAEIIFFQLADISKILGVDFMIEW